MKFSREKVKQCFTLKTSSIYVFGRKVKRDFAKFLMEDFVSVDF